MNGNQPAPHRFYEFGPLALDVHKNRAFVNDEELSFTEDEFAFLYLLAQRSGEHLTFEQLYDAIWKRSDDCGGQEAARQYMDGAVARLNAAGQGKVRIEAAPQGYRYCNASQVCAGALRQNGDFYEKL